MTPEDIYERMFAADHTGVKIQTSALGETQQKILNLVHDELEIYCPYHYIEKAMSMRVKLMQESGVPGYSGITDAMISEYLENYESKSVVVDSLNLDFTKPFVVYDGSLNFVKPADIKGKLHIMFLDEDGELEIMFEDLDDFKNWDVVAKNPDKTSILELLNNLPHSDFEVLKKFLTT